MTEHVTIKSLFIHDTNSPPQKKKKISDLFSLIWLLICHQVIQVTQNKEN